MSARRLGIDATIVMPKTTPDIKVHAVAARGARVELAGNTYDDAYQHARQLAEEKGLTFVHPYDDEVVIAGQGTVAMELMRQHPEPDQLEAVFVPVGGGGLIAGVAAYIKALYPKVKVIGVEPEDAPCFHAALEAGERVVLEQVGIFADGVAVKQVGEEPWRVAKDLVDEVILVSTDEICAAIKDIFEDTRSIAEPAGALGIAGLKKYIEREKVEDKFFAAIDSGANMNFDRLRHVAERAELGELREGLFAVTIPEKPGSFLSFCETLGSRNITEFNYRYAESSDAHIFVGVQLSGGQSEKDQLLSELADKALPVQDLSDNEMAKLHLRYMVGGRANPDNERLLRFEFPERPGALLRFLSRLGGRWNISLFHYRNHGAAYGRVLCGIQVPDGDLQEFHTFLDQLGYRWWEEDSNPAYAKFLRD
jgi:threonine dehydratase